MKTEPQRTCPSCGNELSGAMEFCPVCMLRKALAGGVESGESSASEDTVSPTPEQAVQRFEHYELVKGEDGRPVELGRGAMGVTYKAVDVDLRCPVTLKVITAARAGALGLRYHGSSRPSAATRSNTTLHRVVRNRPARLLANCCPVAQTIACSFIVALQIRFRNKIPIVGVLRRPVLIARFGDGAVRI